VAVEAEAGEARSPTRSEGERRVRRRE
jgi:hypothetical protein